MSIHLETEVKFLMPDLGAFRERLLAAGAVCTRPRVFERNVRFDNAWEGLRRRGQLLRLRQDDRVVLTFKDAAQEGSEAKVRTELEVLVSDFETMAGILERCGFEARQVYEKHRETFALEGVEVVLDELPMGNFIELEGEEGAIKGLAGRLGLEWEERILANYLYLLALVNGYYGLEIDDLTFENFRGVEVVWGEVLAGREGEGSGV